MSWTDMIGYAAAATVLATFCMTNMFHLRLLAIASNVLFICFGSLTHVYPVLLLHMALLPINLARLLQMQASGAITRAISPQARQEDLAPAPGQNGRRRAGRLSLVPLVSAPLKRPCA
jgi:CRP/FNR family transcriptional regulator, cyclic AMP receptor protein